MLAAVMLSNCAGYTSAASTGSGSSPLGSGVLSASATTLSFGSVAMGSTALQTVSVTNTGTGAVNITSAAISGSAFTVMSGNGAATLAVGQSATVQIQFAPTSAATATGDLVITSNASNPTLTIALNGIGAGAGMSITPPSVSFGNVPDGTTATQAIILANTGSANLIVSSATATGTGFAVTGFSAQTLTPNSTMTFNATFTPTSTSAVSGSISVSTSLSGSPTAIPLTGTGTQPGMSVTPSSVSFGDVADGATATQVVTLKNIGTANLVVSSESVTGAGFSVNGFSAQTLAPNNSMAFNVVFAPTSPGGASGSISVSTNLAGSPTAIPLTGTGTQPGISVTPSTVSFGNVADGTSVPQVITVKNTGTANLVVSSATASGTGFSVTGFTAQTLA
ncbi:MAG TPA: choice-of-anchor D domain-containing protein, partial [Candidatus Aquilonibacter sp.]|nr:choice-of-anchor D domain-containing protein [Candidatus Aquilonibacter sp.]